MPLTKRRSRFTRPNIPISPSSPSLPLGPTSKPYPPRSFGRRSREWRRSAKGMERALDHADLHGTEVYRAFNEKGERTGMEFDNLSGEDPSIDALIDIIVHADMSPSDFSPARPFVSASVSNLPNISRSLTGSSSHQSSTAHLSRSLSLHSTATTQVSSEGRPLLPLPPLPPVSVPVVHRKLVKRRPSSTSPSLTSGPSRPWRSAVALPLIETSPTYLGNSIPLPSTSFVTLRGPRSIPPLPEGAEPPVIVHTFSSTSLSRNDSSSTTASSLLPTSEESTGLATPHTDVVEHNRDTFGPSWTNLVYEDEDHMHHMPATSMSTDDQTRDEDDSGLPRFPPSEGRDDDSIGQSSKTSSSAHTTRPRTQMSTSTSETTSPAFHLERVRDRDTNHQWHVIAELQHSHSEAARVPSIYDLGETLRSGADMGSVRSRRTGRYRSVSVGGLSMAETTCSMDEILRSEPMVGRSATVPPSPIYDLVIDKPGQNEDTAIPVSSARRRAPAPPHLLRPAEDAFTNGIGQPMHGVGSANSEDPSTCKRPAIPDRTTSLGLLWRRMSGKSPSTSIPDIAAGASEDGSDTESRRKSKRPGLIRALSRRKTTVSDIVEDVPPVPALPAGHSGSSSRPAQDARSDEAQAGCSVNGSQRPDQRNGIPFPELPIQTVSISVDVADTARDENTAPPSPPARIPHRASSLPIRPDRILLNRVPPLQTILKNSFASIPETNADGITGALILSSPTETIPPDKSTESGVERKRRFRRTLVEVEDDHEFQKLLQGVDGLGTLDTPMLPRDPSSTEACCGHDIAQVESRIDSDMEGVLDEGIDDSGPIQALDSSFLLVEPLPLEIEKHTIQAWFVMRELVQGEKRHGRLLTRGVSIARSFAERAGMALHGVPDLASPVSISPNTSPFKRLSRLSRPASTSRRPRSMHVNSASTLTLPLSTYSSASVLHLEPIEDLSPLEILLHRLPRLLALSLTLSSRFAHDPSPDQVASAFLSMEVDLLLELGEWAGEVGQLIAMGFGGQLDEELRSAAEIRRSSTSDLASLGLLSMSTSSSGTETPQNEVRISFSEVLLGPIQRAARYRLLFHSLANKMPDGSKGKEKVQAALYAAERLVEGVNKGQGFDLDGLRRVGGGDGEGEDGEGEGLVVKRKKGKSGRRVRSMYASA